MTGTRLQKAQPTLRAEPIADRRGHPERRLWLDDSRRFEFGDVAVDATAWTYVLTAFNDHEFYDLTWVVSNVDSLGDIDLSALASIVLQSEVGELLAITRFDRIALVDVDTLDPQIPVSSIVTLHEPLQSFRH